MSQKVIKILLGITIVLFAVVGITGFHEGGGQGDGDNNQTQPVKVGVSLALTGDAAFIGESYQRGLEAAADNLSGQPAINLQYQDNKNSGKAGVNSFRALKQEDSDIILSTFSAPTVSLSPLAEKSDLPLFVSVVFADILSSNENAISFFPTPQNDARATIADLQKEDLRNVSVIYQKSEYGQSGFEAFRRLATENDISVVHAESYTPGTVEFTTPVLKSLEKDPDAVYVVAVNATPIIRQLKSSIGEKKSTPTLYSNLISTFGNLHHKNPNVFKNVHLTALDVSIPNSKARKEFLRLLDGGGYENDSLGYFAVAYDNLQLLHGVLRKNPDPSEFVDTFQSYGRFEGVTGTYQIDNRDEGIKLEPVVYNGKRLERVSSR